MIKKKHIPQHLKAIDLFSGCGGLTQGLNDAGFEVVAAVEIDRKAAETYALNHPDVSLYKTDIRKIEPTLLMRQLGLMPGMLDLLAGCPPCQGFSRLRTKNQGVSVVDPRNNLVGDFFRFIREMMPKTVMMENVPALAKDRRFLKLQRDMEQLGYKCSINILDAADYRVPQRRKRLILLGSLVHQPAAAPIDKERLTVRTAFASVDAPPSRTKDMLHAMPEKRSAEVMGLIAMIPKNGGSRTELGAEFQLDCRKRSGGFGDVYGRMRWDDVAPTITSGCFNPSKGRFLHPSLNRNITLREAALLQGFPPSYIFDVKHGKGAIALMIGNALPPPFIQAHAKGLHEAVTISQTRKFKT